MMFTTYDYTRTLMLKLDLAIPEPGGGCRVMCTFDQALEMVKADRPDHAGLSKGDLFSRLAIQWA